MLGIFFVSGGAVRADPPPPPNLADIGDCAVGAGGGGPDCQGQSEPIFSIAPDASLTAPNSYPAGWNCSNGPSGIPATVSFTGSALYTASPGVGGVYIPGAVTSGEFPSNVVLPGTGQYPTSTYYYQITTQPLPPPLYAGGYYALYSFGTVTVTCPGINGYTLTNAPFLIFIAAGRNASPIDDYFLAAPITPPDLGPCDGSATRSGCAETPEPVDPSSGNEAITEPDDYRSGDGRLRLTRSYNSAAAATGTGAYQIGIGWQNNLMGRRLTWTNQISGLLPEYSVSHSYPDPSTACSQGWQDIAPGQPNSTGVTAAYSNGTCQLSNGQSLPVYSTGISSAYPSTYAGVVAQRPGGALYLFSCSATSCTGNPSVALTLTPTANGYTLKDEDDTVETYDNTGVLQTVTYRGGYSQSFSYATGFLASVTDSFGRTLSFTYGPNGQLQSVATPSGEIQYGYDASGRLSSVTYADGSTRGYTYANGQYPYALTTVADETGNVYATINYDGSGHAYQSSLAGGAWLSSIDYTNPSAPVLTDAFGVQRTYTYTTVDGRQKLSAITGASCNTCADFASATYDSAGYFQSKTDWNGNTTQYSYDDSRGLEVSRTEAYGTPSARTITTQWHPSFRRPTLISTYAGDSATGTPVRTVSYTYDSNGNQLTETITDPATSVSRTWTSTFDSYGRVLTDQGPRTDVNQTTTYQYYTCTTGYQCGQLQSVTNALNQTVTYLAYNADGQPLTLADVNGTTIALTYDKRQRLTSRAVGNETTSFTYYPTGLLKQVTLPDGSYLSYIYDTAHRLTEMDDGAGDRVVYTVDAMGNRTAVNTYDPAGSLARTHTRVFNVLNELAQDIGAAGTAAVTTAFGYDGNGNVTTIDAPLSRHTANVYDELNRLTQLTDPASGVSHFAYDVNDNLSSVKDPRGFTTSYTNDAFGEVVDQSSPDTGNSFKTYDLAGNLLTSTDARGAVANFSYDALNRVSTMAYSQGTLSAGGTIDQFVGLIYDSTTTPNGIGRLESAADQNVSLVWQYDALGRVTQKSQIFVSTAERHVTYAYTSGDLTTLTTPSGQAIGYSYANGRISGITINGTRLLSQVTYAPFGGVLSWQWGNGTVTTRGYDADGRITSISSAGQSSYTYYADGTLQSVTSDAHALDSTQSGTDTPTIDGASNRMTSVSGALTRSYAYDAAGNVLNDGIHAFTYNNAGRLATVTTGGVTTTYTYNALGERVRKVGPSGTTYFVYDESGHLLGEYDGGVNLIEEIVWLGDTPVASIRPGQNGGISVLYVHTDLLNAPTKLARPSDNVVVWRWDHDPYGNGVVLEDPDGDGEDAVFNLRFPGQYHDQETGLLYNGARYYDPLIPHYLESDPMGLAGGNYATYGYANGNPISNADPLGLSSLIYNTTTGTLTVVNGAGQAVGTFPAGNNAQSGSRGPWPPGDYDYEYHTTHPDDAPNSPFGSYGNYVFDVPGCVGCGVHSGRSTSTDRAGRSGVNFATNGCIRTTDSATALISQLIAAGDPLTGLTVTQSPVPTNLPPIDSSLPGGPTTYPPDQSP